MLEDRRDARQMLRRADGEGEPRRRNFLASDVAAPARGAGVIRVVAVTGVILVAAGMALPSYASAQTQTPGQGQAVGILFLLGASRTGAQASAKTAGQKPKSGIAASHGAEGRIVDVKQKPGSVKEGTVLAKTGGGKTVSIPDPNNPGSLNLTGNLGATPRHEGDTGSIEQFWPCVGAERIVPDLNSLYPGAGQAAPFAGAKRALCDRKEVELQNQASVLAKFYVFSSTHIAGHYTGGITDDFASEFDPFSPQFGEKFSPPNLPVAMRDFDGAEVTRVYADQWGAYNGLYFSTYGVNPPNPTGYVPQMAIACMNDPGPIGKTNTLGQFVKGTTVVASADLADQITDPAYNPAYSNFCYEMPFMPGFTAYMDTPVIPTMAFADNYNLPDSEYPNAMPAISSVVNSSAAAPQGPWVTTGSGTPASVKFTLSAVTQGDVLNSISVGATVLTSGPINCNLAILCLGTNNAGQAFRNSAMAGAVTISINARTGVTGYSATVDLPTATVTLTAGVEKVFSTDIRLGFLAHARSLAGSAAPGAGRLMFNDRLDAALALAFMAVVVLVIGASLREWWLVLSRRKEPRVTEAPFVETALAAGD